MYGFLADAVMILHLSFILLVVFGGFLVLRWRRFALLHVPAVLWALVIELRPGTLCPLTPLEQALRMRAGETAYKTGFIDHYLGPIIYPNMTAHDQYAAGFALLFLTVVIYVVVCWKWRSARERN